MTFVSPCAKVDLPRPNAILLFNQQDTALVTDPWSGNAYQESINSTPIRIEAFAREMRQRSREEKSEGLTSNRYPVRGYIVSDPALLQTIDVSEQIEMHWTNPVTGSFVKGLLEMRITPTPYAEELKEGIGINFTGIFSKIGSGETPE